MNCWRKDYLLSLLEFRGTKCKDQRSCIKTGGIVILKDENIKRVFWKLAKIVELLKGKDDIVRAALINIATKNGPPKILRRSIKQLIPIEVTSDEDSELNTTDSLVEDIADTSEGATTVDQSVHSCRSHRAAAVLGEVTRRTWTGH